MRSVRGRNGGMIIAIGVFKLLKGLLLLATGIGALSLLHKDVAATVGHWVQLLRVDPDNQLIHGLLSRLFSISPKQLKEISAGTLIYSGLLLTEGVGLLLRKTWAEYFTVITTAGLIPLELHELAKRFTPVRVTVLAINAGIVVYLIWRIRQPRNSRTASRGFPRHARLQRTGEK